MYHHFDNQPTCIAPEHDFSHNFANWDTYTLQVKMNIIFMHVKGRMEKNFYNNHLQGWNHVVKAAMMKHRLPTTRGRLAHITYTYWRVYPHDALSDTPKMLNKNVLPSTKNCNSKIFFHSIEGSVNDVGKIFFFAPFCFSFLLNFLFFTSIHSEVFFPLGWMKQHPSESESAPFDLLTIPHPVSLFSPLHYVQCAVLYTHTDESLFSRRKRLQRSLSY